MALEETKQLLVRLRKKYHDDLHDSIRDIKPQYPGATNGYSYDGYENNDARFIYNSVGYLWDLFNNEESPIVFNIEGHYITESPALSELKDAKLIIEQNYKNLLRLQIKYQDIETTEYPLTVSLSYYGRIHTELNEIINSQEIIEFEQPGIIERLTKEKEKLNIENNEIKFRLYWLTKFNGIWKYILHFLFFIPFLIVIIWAITNKDNKDIKGTGKEEILIITGILTIIFNYFFNNHNSFKDSWMLIFSRKKLYAKAKEEYKKRNAM